MHICFINPKLNNCKLLFLVIGCLLWLKPYQGMSAPSESKEFMTIESPTEPWFGDLNQMIQRRLIRILIPYNKTLYFIDKNGQQRGLMYDSMQGFQEEINKQIPKNHLKVRFIYLPTTRDKLISDLISGKGDIIAADLSITPERRKLIDFSSPLSNQFDEVIVTSNEVHDIHSMNDLSGKEVYINPSTSASESLESINKRLIEGGLAPVNIKELPGSFEDEDILEMVNANLIGITVSDLPLAEFWLKVFPHIKIHRDITINKKIEIAYGIRKDSPELKNALNKFSEKIQLGTSYADQEMQSYLLSTQWIKKATAPSELLKFHKLAATFQKYGQQYNVDWLLIAAFAYQESGLDQDKRSPNGAIGVMQLMPATAAGLRVGNIEQPDNNIHGGVKYIRQLINRYFDDQSISDFNKTLFAIASYNAGPARIEQYRAEAKKRGLDPNIWFDNVEQIAAEKKGSEVVQYVSNIYKYFIAYKLTLGLSYK